MNICSCKVYRLFFSKKKKYIDCLIRVFGVADEEDILLTGINSYRTTLNLTTLSKNDNAECLADEIADQFKNKPCTNDTGSATVPGTEPQFANYPQILAKCHLNVSDTRDGMIMPACVPRLESSLVLTNFTKSQYSLSLNDSKFTGIGIGKEDDWIVVVLTTNTPEGSYSTATDAEHDSNGFAFSIGVVNYLLIFMFSFCFFLF